MSYKKLAFYLLDSISFKSFARLPLDWCPKKSTLQATISRIGAKTWERISQYMLREAKEEKVEDGGMARIDSTVTEAPIHEPSDSSLLWDSVRVMVRLLVQAMGLPGAPFIAWCNHSLVAKRRARQIMYTRGQDKKAKLYKELVKVCRDTLHYLQRAQMELTIKGMCGMEWEGWLAQVNHYVPLINRIIDQTERRVFAGEKVPASDKVFSLFEEHTDIIIKGNRDIQYGHKLNLNVGKSGLILDAVIETGNPTDTQRFIPMLERHIELYGKAPRQLAADGGYASEDNLEQAKKKGVDDVAFHKKRGLSIEKMVKSPWVYRKLRNFRAGVEAWISCLKRAYGLARCSWKGLKHFNAYVWSSVAAHNLALFCRLKST